MEGCLERKLIHFSEQVMEWGEELETKITVNFINFHNFYNKR
jgi:hypothetical protein